MNGFVVNGCYWRVRMVDRGSHYLIDRTRKRRLATTDPETMTVYLSDELRGSMLTRVLVHEIGHCYIWSYDLFDEIHRMVKPEYWIAAEEWICNFVADYGLSIYDSARKIIGDKAIMLIPDVYERLVA